MTHSLVHKSVNLYKKMDP